MIKILTLFRGHARFIHLPKTNGSSILALLKHSFNQVYQDLHNVKGKLLFQVYDHRYDDYVDLGEDTVLGKKSKIRVQELPCELGGLEHKKCYRMWSLMSHIGDSYVTLQGTSSVCANGLGTDPNGNFQMFEYQASNDSMDTYWSITVPGEKPLALQDKDGKTLEFATFDKNSDRQMFFDTRVGNNYYMMESKSTGMYIGSHGDGTMNLFRNCKSGPQCDHLDLPNPATLFMFTKVDA